MQSLSALGGLAHLVERKHGMFEVTGSIPVSSTKTVNFFVEIDRLYFEDDDNTWCRMCTWLKATTPEVSLPVDVASVY